MLPAAIKALVAVGVDPNFRNKNGETPLHAAALNRYSYVIQALLSAGADLNVRDKDGMTPLHKAAMSNENPTVIKILLDAGADPNVQDDKGQFPWNYAKDREILQEHDVYWRLNDGRFQR